MWCVVACDLENLKNEEAMTRVGSQRHRKKKIPSTRCSVLSPQVPVVCVRHFLHTRFTFFVQVPLQ